MKPISLRTVALAAPIVSLLAVINCAPDDPTITNTGGTGSTTAGTPATTAGTPATTAGTTGTTAGSTSGGSTGTAGTPAGGTGTTAGSGGAPAAGSGGAPAGGMGGSGGAAEVVTVEAILSGPSSFNNPGWKDSWFVTGCGSKHDHDCYTMEQCPAAGMTTKETFPIGGTPGQKYKVTFQYNGVNEGRSYTGGKKDKPVAGDLNTRMDNDSFHRDGSADVTNKYNEMKMTVFDDKGAEARHYYMNSFSAAQENHFAFLSSYKKSIVIVGGGKIEHKIFDSNCHAIDNCNAGEVVGTTCNQPRRLPGADSQLMLPPFYQNPNDGYKIGATNLISPINNTRNQPWKAQASHITVTAIEKTSDPVTMDYPDP